MKRIGVESIEPGDALPVIEQLLPSRQARIAVVKASPEALRMMSITERSARAPLPPETSQDRAETVLAPFDAEAPHILRNVQASAALEAYSRRRLEETGLPVPDAVAPQHRALADALRAVPQAPADAMDREALLSRFPTLAPHVELLEACLEEFHAILVGRVNPLSILFPGGSFARVEGIYRDNPVADHFNRVVAGAASRHQARIGRPVRILEIGAGTGSTARAVIPELGDTIAEYCFTDLSHAFLKKAQDDFAACKALRTRIYNVETEPAFDRDYDVVIATNVIHATRDISRALRHIRAVLTEGGVLLLNEVTSVQTYATLTFGLTEGWWLNAGGERLAGSPLLDEAAWRRLLSEAGFGIVHHHGNDEQGVFAAHAVAAEPSPVRADEVMVRPLSSSPDGTAIRRFVAETIAGVMGMAAEEIADDVPFAEYGIDSLITLELMKPFQERVGYLPATLFFEHPTLAGLAAFLADNHAAAFASAPTQDEEPTGSAAAPLAEAAEPEAGDTAPARAVRRAGGIAVIGMAGSFPGADGPEALFDRLKRRVPAWGPVPAARWNAAGSVSAEADPTYTATGAFLDRVDRFDNEFFGVTPLDAKRMDPQERRFLQTAYDAFLDAGYPARRLAGTRTGVFVGVMTGGYAWLTPRRRDSAAGTSLYWSIANRVSYAFDLKGPSLAVDTACSSSLSALHVAARAIAAGDCDLALVGGVNLIVHPRQFENLCRLHMLSPSGACRPFGEGGDGFVDGEAVCAVLLKPLEAAERDGDRVDGVLLASGVNAGGRANGYSAPNLDAQARLIRETIAQAGCDAAGIDAFEAHGTGTALGDPIEWQAITRALAELGGRSGEALPIGSIKGHIGHLESAAGLAGAIKMLLQMRHGTLLPSLGAETLNPHLAPIPSPLAVVAQARPWPQPKDRPRRGAVSSFGAGGANAHAIFEAGAAAPMPAARDEGPHLFLLSARTQAALDAWRVALRDFALTSDQPAASVAASLGRGRDHDRFRLACVADSLDDLAARLGAPVAGERLVQDTTARNATAHDTPAVPDDPAPWIEAYSRGGARRREAADRLSRAYMSGASLAWDRLFAGHPTTRLPPYPFEDRFFWIDAQESRFDDPAILSEDHRVEGRPVLPAGYLLARLLEDGGTDAVSGISFQRWAESAEAVAFERRGEILLLRDHLGTLASAECGGRASYLPAAARPDLPEGVAGLGAAEIYARFAERGYGYGGAFRNLAHAVATRMWAVGRISPCRTFGLPVSPVLLDAGFQIAILMDPDGPRMAPIAVGTVTIHHRIRPDETVEVECRRREGRDGRTTRFDLAFRRLDGTVLVAIEELVSVATGRAEAGGRDPRPSHAQEPREHERRREARPRLVEFC